ncbi:branched-chain amino acid transport system II carrier protein [Peptacetobacter hiranonis]|uniref:Branched-chain amino acid transport system carrier protein n=1 Tax=Peptacetobacter hiranonis (strain DSM 13275 / JCM 10541 / KCTC 15199 / TO-931) TaxID=500633 RepID=B6FZ77_PEPHT|nr:branched-chain amino acid transport system II carrier protein [Peptacetobacter hiranonis]EEA85181.1 branched-chain amino acid transport system II carrier protein [Peptacetobacter hiranonis DSM 13275]QEK21041.1 Branched-chain amino acid transport system 2 carrier protein [Peptacetobacter hiranonis]
MIQQKGNFKDVIVFGFALFAMFFGAGNLIFPPYLGIITGPEWLTAFGGFTFADAGLALLAVMATAKYDGDVIALFRRAGGKLAIVLGCADILCIGPFLAIPRTGATTYEMGIMPLLGDAIPIAVFAAIFFILTYILTIKPSKVVDIVGRVLTPALLIALAVIIVKGVISPLGPIVEEPMIQGVVGEGIAQGYQTMDAFAAIALASVLIVSLNEKGYNTVSDKLKAIMKSGVLACVGLALVYGGLCFLGATVSTMYGVDAQQSQVIVNITEGLLGQTGKVILAVCVALACLTTSIGLTSATGQFFEKLSGGKLKYKTVVLAVCIFSACMASIGVGGIIKVASPVLSIVYPPTIVLVILAFFTEKIQNDNVYKFAVYTSLIVSILTVIQSYGVAMPFLDYLPLKEFGFNWVVPVLIAGVIGHFVPGKNSELENA